MQHVVVRLHFCEYCHFVFPLYFLDGLLLFWHSDHFYVQDFGAFTSLQMEMGGTTRSGAQMVLNLFFSQSFSRHLLKCLFTQAGFLQRFCFVAWLWLYLDVDLEEQNITQGHFSSSANPRWLTVTLRPLWPDITGLPKGNWFCFLKESNLFLISALNALHRSYNWSLHIHQNMCSVVEYLQLF